MRFVVVGAGAVGGVVGGRLSVAGEHVLFVAHGAHGKAMAEQGLVVESPDGSDLVRAPVVDAVGEWRPLDGDVVVLGVKSQDTVGVLDAMVRATGGADVPVVCLQNGVDNERKALRRFPRVYGVNVMAPTEHLRPGVVRAYSTPVPGVLDIGRWPAAGEEPDDLAEAIAAAFRWAGFSAEAVPDISRKKHRKLIMNLGNAIEALVGPDGRLGEVAALVKAEGETVLAAAGIDVASEEEDLARRGDLIRIRPVQGERRGGGSTWQSLQRGRGTSEVDYLNGEIVLLGRLHGVPTPVNALLQRLANQAAATGTPPGAMTEAELVAMLRAAP